MRNCVAAVLALTSAVFVPPAAVPAAAQSLEVQYGGYSRDYDDDFYGDDAYGNDDSYDDRRRYGRDRSYRSYGRDDDDRYDDGSYEGRGYDGRRYRERRGDDRRYRDDGRRRDTVVKKLTRQDRICLKRHSSYDPETGTFRDGRGGRKPCRA